MTEARAKTKKKVTIIVNNRPLHLEDDEVLAELIKERAGIPIANLLFLEDPGPGDDIPFPDGIVVHVKSGQHYYDMPPGNFGAHK